MKPLVPTDFMLALPVIVALAGYMSPESFETDPAEVTTCRGIVTCQLYTHNRVIWDRAIHRPETMSVSDAGTVCVNEGKRLARKG